MVEMGWSAVSAREYDPTHLVRLLEPHCLLGESARWDPTAKELVWVDLLRGFVYHVPWQDRLFGEVRSEYVGDVAAFECSVAPGKQVLALKRHAIWASPPTESHISEVPIPIDHRFNDGALDASGRLVAGTMPEDGTPGLGQLWSLSPSQSPRRLLDGLNLPNGIAFSSTGDRVFVIDSIPGLILEFEYDLESGDIGQKVSEWAIAVDGALPDGMTIDQGGFLWIAMWDGHCVVRFDPKAGTVVDRVEIPASRPTSVALNEDDQTLFVTSAMYGLETPHPEFDGAVYALSLTP